jgi:argininosuccinate synthase
MKKVVLAFSGGLDTSFCVTYLKESGYDVVTATVDTGGFTEEDIKRIENRSKELGSIKHVTMDGKRTLFDKIISYIIKGNILRGGVYPLCAGPERIIQAAEVAKVALEEGAIAIAHGSTGAGNDQVRFDLALRVVAPQLKVLAPVRELGKTRSQEAEFLQKHGYSTPQETKEYSVNKGLLGTTIGGKETLGSWDSPPDEVYTLTKSIKDTPDQPEKVIIGFEKGLPKSLNQENLDPVSLMKKLNEIGGKHGVGRDIHLGNTIFGIKGRIAFEAPASLILIKAHKELEKLVLTKQQSFWKDHLADVYGTMIHEGLYFDPCARDIEAMIDSSQTCVTGEVKVKLFKGNSIVEGLRSPFSLMDKKIASYGEESLMWTGKDAEGFCKIYGIQTLIASKARSDKK